MSGTLFERLQATMATTLKVAPSKITPQLTNEDLAAWDSLGQVNLMMALEQTFDLYIEVEDFEGLHSVPAILDYLQRSGVK
jgi:acyl carrier protein